LSLARSTACSVTFDVAGVEAGAQLLDAFVVVAHAVAGPVDREDGAVVEEPVEEGGDDGGSSKNLPQLAMPRLVVRMIEPCS
jgi:hypothetical protein